MTTVQHDAVHVIVDRSPEELTSLAVEFGGTSNWSVPLIGTAAPVQILQRRPTRSKAVINIPSLGGLGAGNSASIFGTVVAPVGAGTTIATTGTLPAGTYSVGATVSTAGTVTVADANNMQLLVGATSVATLMNTNTGANTPNPNGPFIVTVPAGGATISVKSIGAGSGTATYSAQIIANAQSGSGGATAIVLAYRPDYLANAANPQGYVVSTTPHVIQWENQQPCYAAAIGGGPVTISTIDQAQAAAQAVAEEMLESDSYPDELGMMEGARYGGARDANQY